MFRVPEKARGGVKEEVLLCLLRNGGGPMKLSDIAREVGRPVSSVDKALRRLRELGFVEKTDRGEWRVDKQIVAEYYKERQVTFAICALAAGSLSCAEVLACTTGSEIPLHVSNILITLLLFIYVLRSMR